MGSNMNFNNPIGGGAASNRPLIRQSSVYSLTFDEFQSTMGGVGKDFGSMNMDELLKNIWTAEETQALAMASSSANAESNYNNNNININNNGYYNNPNGDLQRQGSLTLPRTLSQKTVDEVWRDLMKDSGINGVASSSTTTNPASASAMPQRQQTLGEMTLEEFLVRAGVVREDNNNLPFQIGKPNGTNNNQGFNLGFQHQQQQPNGNNLGNNNNRMVNSTNPISKQPPTLSLQVNPNPNPSANPNLNPTSHQHQHHQQQSHHQPPLFPKPANVAFAAAAAPVHFMNNSHLTGSGARGGMMGVQGGGSPASQMSPEVMTKSTGDTTSSLSPVPYVINRGRKCSAIEKVVERRQRRMIKNRESAARSRARKQAYTLELESEVKKLQELNEELQRKHAEYMEMQKNEALETLRPAWGGKRHCLRRTLTGPW